MHNLAIRGIDEPSQSLRSAFCYTPILAGMWINRVIMLEVAVTSEAWPALELNSKTQVDFVPERIHQLRQFHLCEGSFSNVQHVGPVGRGELVQSSASVAVQNPLVRWWGGNENNEKINMPIANIRIRMKEWFTMKWGRMRRRGMRRKRMRRRIRRNERYVKIYLIKLIGKFWK